VRLSLEEVYLLVLDGSSQVQVYKVGSDDESHLHLKNVENLRSVLQINLDVALSSSYTLYQQGLVVLAELDLDYIRVTQLNTEFQALTYPVCKLVVVLIEEVDIQRLLQAHWLNQLRVFLHHLHREDITHFGENKGQLVGEVTFLFNEKRRLAIL